MKKATALKKLSRLKEARIKVCTEREIVVHGWFTEIKVYFQGDECIIFTTRYLHQISRPIEDYSADRHHKNFKSMLLDYYKMEERYDL